MMLTRRVASLALRPSITRASLPARRTYVEVKGEGKASQPAKQTEIKKDNTLMLTGMAAAALAACYFIFLSKPEVVGSEATGKPEKARDPKMTRER